MVMRWLTRGWHGSGEQPLDDAEAVEREAAYRAHVQSLLPCFLSLRAFVGEPVEACGRSLHDARVQRWEVDLPRRLRLEVVCGDLRRGYKQLGIEYETDVEL